MEHPTLALIAGTNTYLGVINLFFNFSINGEINVPITFFGSQYHPAQLMYNLFESRNIFSLPVISGAIDICSSVLPLISHNHKAGESPKWVDSVMEHS